MIRFPSPRMPNHLAAFATLGASYATSRHVSASLSQVLPPQGGHTSPQPRHQSDARRHSPLSSVWRAFIQSKPGAPARSMPRGSAAWSSTPPRGTPTFRLPSLAANASAAASPGRGNGQSAACTRRLFTRLTRTTSSQSPTTMHLCPPMDQFPSGRCNSS